MTKKHKRPGKSFLDIDGVAEQFHVTNATVCGWMKKGCPVKRGKMPNKTNRMVDATIFDIELVREWLVSKNLLHLVSMDANRVSPEASAKNAKIETDELKQIAAQVDIGEGLENAIARLRTMEVAAFKAYQAAVADANPILQQIKLKLHSDVIHHLIRAEEQVNTEKMLTDKIWTEVLDRVGQGVENVKMLISQAPRALASRTNPTDPAMAESVIREWVNSQLFTMLGRIATK